MKHHTLRQTIITLVVLFFAVALIACKGAESGSDSGPGKGQKTNPSPGDTTAPTNQDEVFATSKTVSDGDRVAIVSSGDVSNDVWFAPAGTTAFEEGADMTKAASGTATTIIAPTTPDTYHLYLVDAAGNRSEPSTAALTVAIWVQDAYLKASNSEVDDFFGNSVAVSDNLIVVGAYGEDSATSTINNADNSADTSNDASKSGAAYIFKKESNGNWFQDAYLKASNSDSEDEFGHSVAVSDDLIVVGAYHEGSAATTINNTDNSADTSNDASESGSAYIFKRDATGDWFQDAYLKTSNSESGDNFGHSVAISGDLVVVGAPHEDSAATTINNTDNSADEGGGKDSSGAAYIFKRDASGDWFQDAYLKASNSDKYDYFGYSVAISGEIIVVGSKYEDNDATTINNADNSADTGGGKSGSGAAYIFKRDASGDWFQDAYLKASNSGGDDNFGKSVAISGEIVVVGAPHEDSAATTINNTDNSADAGGGKDSSGAAYIFKRDTSGDWIQDAYLKASNSDKDDYFGHSVAISGEIVVVGAFREDGTSESINNSDGSADTGSGSGNNGAAYIFKKDINGDWIQDAYLKASNSDNYDNFGNSVAISGEIVVVGAFLEDSEAAAVDNNDGSASTSGGKVDSGAAYIFKR